jgi:hypothetical protein
MRVVRPTAPQATNAPFLIDDFVGPGGSGPPDDRDEIVVHGSASVELHAMDVDEPLMGVTPGFFHGVSANADFDGDGRRELLSTISATLSNQVEVIDPAMGLATAWGPDPLGRPTGQAQVLATPDFDADGLAEWVYVTGDGSLEAFSGTDGSLLGRAFLEGGEIVGVPSSAIASLSAVIAADVDGDGAIEAVVGTEDGWLYAVGGPPEFGARWAIEVGAGVRALAMADVDGDGAGEVLVSTDAGDGIVVDGLGVSLEISADCVSGGQAHVVGSTSGLDTVQFYVNGVQSGAIEVGGGGPFQVTLMVAGAGEHEVRAEGYDEDGFLRAISTADVVPDEDADGDGVTLCGGDCAPDDPTVFPGADEICGDLVDQDCDGGDEPCDGETFGDDGYNMWGRGCRCSTAAGFAWVDASGLFALVVVVAVMRRRPRRDRPGPHRAAA